MKKRFKERAVVELLACLTKEELKEFANFLGYKGSSNVEKLWSLLRKKHPEYKVLDEKLYQSIRPTKAFNANVFNGWVAELYRLLKEFVTLVEFQQDELQKANTQARALLKRRAQRSYQKALREARKALDNQQERDVGYYHYKYKLEDINYQFVTLYKHHGETASLQLAVDYYDHDYLAHKLKFLVVMRNRERIVNSNYNYRLEAEILGYLSTNPQEDFPLIHLYHLLVLLHQDISKHKLLKKFVHYFLTHKSVISSAEVRQLLTFSINICFWNIGEGRLEFLQDRFELTKLLVEGNYAEVRGFIPSYHFRGIMRNAIEAKQLDWATWFLAYGLPKTKKGEREILEALNTASLCFSKGAYKEQAAYMRQLAQQAVFTDIYSNITYRILCLKTAFTVFPPKPKSMEIESFKQNLDNFRIFLDRETSVNASYIKSCQNFRKALSLLFHKRYGKKKVSSDLKALVLEMGPVLELAWLLEQS